jgi:hypothetical protein
VAVSQLTFPQIDSISAVHFSRSDDTVLFFKQSKDGGKSQELLVFKMNTNDMTNILVKYPKSLEGNFSQHYEVIDNKTIYCLHVSYNDSSFEDAEVSLMRMDITKQQGKLTATFDVDSDYCKEMAYAGTLCLTQAKT